MEGDKTPQFRKVEKDNLKPGDPILGTLSQGKHANEKKRQKPTRREIVGCDRKGTLGGIMRHYSERKKKRANEEITAQSKQFGEGARTDNDYFFRKKKYRGESKGKSGDIPLWWKDDRISRILLEA